MGAFEDDMDYALRLARKNGEILPMFGNSGDEEDKRNKMTKTEDDMYHVLRKEQGMSLPGVSLGPTLSGVSNYEEDRAALVEKANIRKPALTLATRDTNGYLPDRHLIGLEYRHTNGKVYRIQGFGWDSESDQWKLILKCDDDPIPCFRGLHNFFADNEHGQPRYKLIQES